MFDTSATSRCKSKGDHVANLLFFVFGTLLFGGLFAFAIAEGAAFRELAFFVAAALCCAGNVLASGRALLQPGGA